MHARLAGEILRDVGYGEERIRAVGRLLRKEGLDSDPDAQTLEDVACLVFLEHYADEFLGGRDERSRARILRKTWRKMSPRARAAVAELSLPPAVAAAVEELLPVAAGT